MEDSRTVSHILIFLSEILSHLSFFSIITTITITLAQVSASETDVGCAFVQEEFIKADRSAQNSRATGTLLGTQW